MHIVCVCVLPEFVAPMCSSIWFVESFESVGLILEYLIKRLPRKILYSFAYLMYISLITNLYRIILKFYLVLQVFCNAAYNLNVLKLNILKTIIVVCIL